MRIIKLCRRQGGRIRSPPEGDRKFSAKVELHTWSWCHSITTLEISLHSVKEILKFSGIVAGGQRHTASNFCDFIIPQPRWRKGLRSDRWGKWRGVALTSSTWFKSFQHLHCIYAVLSKTGSGYNQPIPSNFLSLILYYINMPCELIEWISEKAYNAAVQINCDTTQKEFKDSSNYPTV